MNALVTALSLVAWILDLPARLKLRKAPIETTPGQAPVRMDAQPLTGVSIEPIEDEN